MEGEGGGRGKRRLRLNEGTRYALSCAVADVSWLPLFLLLYLFLLTVHLTPIFSLPFSFSLFYP